MSTRSASMP